MKLRGSGFLVRADPARISFARVRFQLLLAQGVAFVQDADVELELLLVLALAVLEPAAEDLQKDGASSEGGQAGDLYYLKFIALRPTADAAVQTIREISLQTGCSSHSSFIGPGQGLAALPRECGEPLMALATSSLMRVTPRPSSAGNVRHLKRHSAYSQREGPSTLARYLFGASGGGSPGKAALPPRAVRPARMHSGFFGWQAPEHSAGTYPGSNFGHGGNLS
jgi:hypothetical protein